MNLVEINGGVYGSTGKIMLSIAVMAEKEGYNVLCCAPITKTNKNKNSARPYYKIGSYFSRLISVIFDRLFGGKLTAVFSTKKLIKELRRFAPDIIHLHVIHGGYLNLRILFDYIKKNNIKLVWTFHDCWAFTGHCPHFVMYRCDKWKSCCNKCPQYREYPKSYFDNSKNMFRFKKNLFSDIGNMTIVTPSRWLAGLVKQSFLKDYPVTVINNGIDLNIFKPIESDFRSKYNIDDKTFIILGVSFGWTNKKGVDVFIELSKRLSSDYKIVLIGTDDATDKLLPENIISIHRTQDQTELAEIYTAANLLVNPTREENYPTVNMESLACGTPVLTFRTGGSPEIIDETCGSVVECDDIDAFEKEIMRIRAEEPYSRNACLMRARSFDMNERFKDYIELFKKI